MACLSVVDIQLTVQKAIIDGAKSAYESALSTLNNIGQQASLAALQLAKSAAKAAAAAALSVYNAAVSAYQTISSALSKLDALIFESAADAIGSAMQALLDLIPGAPGLISEIASAVTAMKEMQC